MKGSDGVSPGVTEFNYDDYFDDDEDEKEERPAPYVKGSETSREAAESLTTRRDDAKRVLDLYATGNHTRDEVVVALGESRYSTFTARVSDLCDAGCLIETGERRKTRRGRNADVLTLAPGAKLEWFVDWLRGDRPSVQTHRQWLKELGKVVLQWAEVPTSENEAAVRKVMLAGKAFITKAARHPGPSG